MMRMSGEWSCRSSLSGLLPWRRRGGVSAVRHGAGRRRDRDRLRGNVASPTSAGATNNVAVQPGRSRTCSMKKKVVAPSMVSAARAGRKAPGWAASPGRTTSTPCAPGRADRLAVKQPLHDRRDGQGQRHAGGEAPHLGTIERSECEWAAGFGKRRRRRE
jgi:hypothetical protein